MGVEELVMGAEGGRADMGGTRKVVMVMVVVQAEGRGRGVGGGEGAVARGEALVVRGAEEAGCGDRLPRGGSVRGAHEGTNRPHDSLTWRSRGNDLPNVLYQSYHCHTCCYIQQQRHFQKLISIISLSNSLVAGQVRSQLLPARSARKEPFSVAAYWRGQALDPWTCGGNIWD